MTTPKLKTRRSLIDLEMDYTQGNKAPLENLMRAWKGIKELDYTLDDSFFKIGGYHGEPFRGGGWGNASYWGGYCNHGNILFPTWHRVYLLRLEKALQSIPGCEDVVLPYWDETDESSIINGIPSCLTDKHFTLDGIQIENPLRSFVFPRNITDNISQDPSADYSKPKDYETKRYPQSGLMGPGDIAATIAHNDQYDNDEDNVVILNNNVKAWLTSHITVGKVTYPTNLVQKFKDCLDAPNFTVFSNTSSAAEWNGDRQTIDPVTGKPMANDPNFKAVVSLESPHNSIHLAVGGCEIPGYNRSPIPGANGDMGENDTAALDPIFYFHHCNIDRVFWLWQKKHGATDELEIIPEYPGTNTIDNQGPTPGFAPNTWLTLDSPLEPFKKNETDYYNSRDCINIETQLGYTYSQGSMDDHTNTLLAKKQDDFPSKIIKVSKINKAPVRGSFTVSAFMNVNGEKLHLGTEAILSRWNSQFCANCQTHLEVKAFFKLPIIETKLFSALNENPYEHVEIEIHGRDGFINGTNKSKLLNALEKPVTGFHLEII